MHFVLIVILYGYGTYLTKPETHNTVVSMQEFNDKAACEAAQKFVLFNADRIKVVVCTPMATK